MIKVIFKARCIPRGYVVHVQTTDFFAFSASGDIRIGDVNLDWDFSYLEVDGQVIIGEREYSLAELCGF